MSIQERLKELNYELEVQDDDRYLITYLGNYPYAEDIVYVRRVAGRVWIETYDEIEDDLLEILYDLVKEIKCMT